MSLPVRQASTRSSSAPAAPACAPRCSSRRPACRSRCSPRSSRRARTPSPRRAASALRSATWARTAGSGTCTTRSRARTGWATRTRSSTCARWRRRWSTSSSTSACPSTATPTARSTSGPFGGHSANFGEKTGAACVRVCRPHRPRDAAHALSAQRARADAILRRMDGARPGPQRATARCSASPRWRWKPARS